MSVTLRDFMTSEDVLTISGEATIGEAARRLSARNVGAAVVLEGDAVAGIFTERDLLRAIAAGRQPEDSIVRDCMTRDPITLPPDHAPSEAAELMSAGRFRHIPVVEQGRLVGIVSIRDLVVAGLHMASEEANVGSDFP
jgi:CBS domain-containing protein